MMDSQTEYRIRWRRIHTSSYRPEAGTWPGRWRYELRQSREAAERRVKSLRSWLGPSADVEVHVRPVGLWEPTDA